MSEVIDHDAQEVRDLQTQHLCAERIIRAEQTGDLIGQEAPVYQCHTFFPSNGGDTYARILTRQLNHLAGALGVLGFQVSYKEDSLDPNATRPDRGFFEVRVFAEAPPKS